MTRSNRDLGETAFMVFICLMMVIGGLSEGYPGLAVFGGFILALLALGLALQFVGPIGPKISSLPRPVLILLALPVGALALYTFTVGDSEMKLWAVLLAVGWAGLIVASFLADGAQTLKITLPGIRVEGEEAEAMARALGLEPPDTSGMRPGETREKTIVKAFEFRPGDLGTVEEAVARLVLAPHRVNLRKVPGELGEGTLSRARQLLAAGGAAEAVAELDSIIENGGAPAGARALRGAALGQLGRYDDALVDLDDITALPRAAEAWFARGEAQRRLGHEDLAREAYEQAAAFALSEPDGRPASDAAVLPLALERMGNAEGALRSLEGLLAKTPDNASLLCVQALLSAKAGTQHGVYETLERALSSDPHRVLLTLDEAALTPFMAEGRFQSLRERAERARSQRIERLRGAR